MYPRPFVSNNLIQWRVFIGLIRNIQPEPKKTKQTYDPNQDLESDDEADPKPDQAEPTTVTMVDSPEKRSKMEEERQNNSPPKAVNEEVQERIQRARDRRDEHKDFFLNDPELSVKIFLSSHFRDKGYI